MIYKSICPVCCRVLTESHSVEIEAWVQCPTCGEASLVEVDEPEELDGLRIFVLPGAGGWRTSHGIVSAEDVISTYDKLHASGRDGIRSSDLAAMLWGGPYGASDRRHDRVMQALRKSGVAVCEGRTWRATW